MPSRKPHSKSRHGCDTCKKSKVRCDLERPICYRCTRLNRPCSFANDVDLPHRSSTDHPAKSSKSTTPTKFPETMPQLGVKDLELMHQYSTMTCFTMSDDELLMPLWQYGVPRQAFTHEFLLHGILALTALQRRHECEASQRTILADHAASHQQAALSTYIPLLQSIDEHNCHALFAFSAILGAVSFGFLQFPEHQPTSIEFVNDVIDVFDLLVGAKEIAIEARTWLKAGPLAALLGPNPFGDLDVMDCDFDARASLDAVLQCTTPISSPPSLLLATGSPATSTYHASVQLLSALFPREQLTTVRTGKIIGWPVFMGPNYLSLLKQHDPKALAILGHYAVALYVSGTDWYLRDLGSRLVRAVFDLLDTEWRPLMAWPLARTST